MAAVLNIKVYHLLADPVSPTSPRRVRMSCSSFDDCPTYKHSHSQSTSRESFAPSRPNGQRCIARGNLIKLRKAHCPATWPVIIFPRATMAAGLKTIIALSFVSYLPNPFTHPLTHLTIQILAIGFLLVILSSALFQNYLTLLVVATYVLAPVPNWLCSRAANPDDFMDSGSNSIIELGRFMTGFLVVMGVGMFVFLIERAPITTDQNMADIDSVTCCLGAYGSDKGRGHDHVYRRWAVDLWDYHQLYHVFPRRAGVLRVACKRRSD